MGRATPIPAGRRSRRPRPIRGVVAAALLAVLAACAPRGGAGGAPSPATGGGTTTLRVLVYNIHAGQDAAGAPNLDRVAELVRRTAADLVLLQEVDRGTRRSGGVDQIARLAEATGLAPAFGKTLDYQGGDYGIALLSRRPLEGPTLVRLPVDPPQLRSEGRTEPRGALRATIAPEDGAPALVVINTHLDPSGDARWRRQEIRTLLALADSARAAGAAVLVGGDLNSTPESAEQEAVRASGLRDAWRECAGSGAGDGFTYSAAAPVKRIDYLYFGAPFRCRSAEVLASDASDHRPLLVVLELTRER